MSTAQTKTPIPPNKPLTSKQKAFVRELKRNPKLSATQAVLKTYGKPNKPTTYTSAQSIAHENLRKPNVLYALAKHDRTVQQRLIDLTELTTDENPQNKRIALDAINSTLDRLHGKPVSKSISSTVDTIDQLLNSGEW